MDLFNIHSINFKTAFKTDCFKNWIQAPYLSTELENLLTSKLNLNLRRFFIIKLIHRESAVFIVSLYRIIQDVFPFANEWAIIAIYMYLQRAHGSNMLVINSQVLLQV